MGNDKKKRYRLTAIYASDDGQGHQTTRMQIDPGVYFDVNGEPLEMTEDQADRVRRFGQLELVTDDEDSIALIDQTGGVSTSTATVPRTGSTPDLSKASSADLKGLAKDAGIEGRTTMSDAQLKQALADHFNSQGV